MRVLVVGPYPPSDDTNSLRARAWAEAQVRSRDDVTVRVAASDPGRAYGDAEPEAGPSSERLSVGRVWNRDLTGAEIAGRIVHVADEFAPDVAHLHFNFFTYGDPVKSFLVLHRLLVAFERRRIRTVVTLHSVLASPSRYFSTQWGFASTEIRFLDRLLARIEGLLLSWALAPCDEVVVTSPLAVDWLRSHSRLSPGKIRQIALGTLGEPSLSRTARSAIDGNAPRTTAASAISIGMLSPYKGLKDLVSAAGILARQHRAVQVTVLGRAEVSHASVRRYLRALRVLVRKEGSGSVRFDDRHVPPEEFARLREEADVIVLPFRDDGILGASGTVLDLVGSSGARVVLARVPRLEGYEHLPGVVYCESGDPSGLAESIWAAAQQPRVDPVARSSSFAVVSCARVSSEYLATYSTLLHESGFRGPIPTTPSSAGPSPRPMVAPMLQVGAITGLPKGRLEGEGPHGPRADLFPSRGAENPPP